MKTDGSGTLSFAAAGADLYAANESSPSAQPSATGANAVAIGEAPTASGADSFAVQGGTASGSGSVSIGRNVGGGNVSLSRANSTVAIMGSTTSSNHYATAIGLNSSAHLATVAGSGMGAMALGGSYASGTNSFAAAIATNSSSYGATGSGAAALMNYAKASSSNSGAFGFGANATNSMAYAFGAQTFATGNSSVSLGRNSLASATYSICIGNAGQNNIQSSIKFSGSQHSAQGDAQIGLYPLMADTTDATATAMVTNHQSTPGAGTANQIVLPNNSAYAFYGTIVARQKAGDGTACAAFKVEGLIRREANAGTTVLVNSATTVLDNTPNWGMALSADTTNGGLAITVTGAASTNIRWTTSITTSELTYA